MLKRIKALLSFLGVFILLMISAGATMAQTFSDVTDGDWYFSYVEQLAEKGIIDTTDHTYRPNDELTRAELVDMVIKATNGLAGFQPSGTPTFSDVPLDAEYYDYVEAAATRGIVSGYTDANGNPTGLFGPNDTVTRAAATKVIMSAFDIPQNTGAISVFPDVAEGSWYYPYVVGAYNESIIDGYENGTFGPGDTVTRAQIAKLIVNAQNPIHRSAESKPEEPEMGKSELQISLSKIQPSSLTVPRGSTASLLSLDLTATGSSDVHVSQIALSRSGVGNATDWLGLYLYNGVIKVTSEFAVDQNTNKVSIPVNLLIQAGQTVTISAYGDISLSATPLDRHAFFLSSPADIQTDAGSVTGTFPITGNIQTIGNVIGNYMTIVPGSLLSQPKRDQASEVATFKLTSGPSGDVSVNVLTLTQGGTLSSSKMTSCRLMRNSDVLATAEGFYEDQVTFVLQPHYVVPGNQSRNFSVKCYINGGRSTDTVQLYLDESYDLLLTDLKYGFPAAPLNYFTKSMAPSVTLKPAQVIIQ